MTDAELKRLLKAAAPPERTPEYWDDFPRRVSRGPYRPSTGRRAERSLASRFAWAGVVALCCLVAGYFIGHRSGGTNVISGDDRLLQDQKFIRELTSMFPNRVRAIVRDEAGVRLVLAEEANMPKSMPIWVKICQGQSCTSLITFSGQELQIAGENFTVLADSKGGVILAGERFAWTSSDAAGRSSELKIQAKTLEFASR